MNTTITVAELIEMLKRFPQNAVLVNLDLEPASIHLDLEKEGLVIEAE
jgi:hypothetical protein